MDYHEHYNRLMNRAKTRSLDEYCEKHHIIPRCLGGNDSESNIVKLTPEEHFVAHQLLVKMYPNSERLIFAANMMSVNSKKQQRNNKTYGWLKRKQIKILSKQSSGSNNSQYGTRWITNGIENQKIKKTDNIPEGWNIGRTLKSKIVKTCKSCDKKFIQQKNEITCSKHCRDSLRNTGSFHGREKEFLTLYNSGLSMNKALQEMGYPGAISHWYRWAKEILDAS